jgi:hypothetical protein
MNKQQIISEVLFELDPMGTCCKENEIFDEYDDVAKLIDQGLSIKAAFFKQFWSGCLNNRELETIKEAIDVKFF